ncbi:hypothetical protein HPO96_19755 [Kribbella sandramycini]|uniref:Uncharacterized protein n=1 Tax=Kribbella sandramycini TaxID=60450 RepID=A0A7Y4P1U5_9ACTN|nr:hypothetical protein [Kribbella sandramycini]MBB6564785.1 hypothetical protein [Kribbella sandramycini]NOL42485.1 hypothetical protein [Kribbella sandramycini]
MFPYSSDAVMAEARYRQEKLRREYQRPGRLWRKAKARRVEPCAPELRARPAM